LGKKQAQRTRPIVLTSTLDSSTTKRKILDKRVALAGSKIYINPDLTNEQRQAEKRLRDSVIPIAIPELQAAGVME